jgi:hypothetical protein
MVTGSLTRFASDDRPWPSGGPAGGFPAAGLCAACNKSENAHRRTRAPDLEACCKPMCALRACCCMLWQARFCGKTCSTWALLKSGWKGELPPALGEATPDRMLLSWRIPEFSDVLLDRRIDIFALQTSTSPHQAKQPKSIMCSARLKTQYVTSRNGIILFTQTPIWRTCNCNVCKRSKSSCRHLTGRCPAQRQSEGSLGGPMGPPPSSAA